MPVKVSCLFTNAYTLAHDVASDMIDAGLKSVVMVQRSRTGECHYATSRLVLKWEPGVIPVQYYTQSSERKKTSTIINQFRLISFL
jgi:hypothetical protein